MKQTAVEWLEDKYKKLHIPIPKILFDHAKAMEKEQMEDSYCFGILDSGEDGLGFNHYYNKTFKL
jgi:hypothetical protein